MKATGAEIIDFFRHGFPGPEGDWYFDEEEIPVYDDSSPDTFALDPAEVYETDKLGNIFWQGKGDAPQEDGHHVTWWFSRWRRAKTETTFVLSVPNEEAAEARALFKKRKWRISR